MKGVVFQSQQFFEKISLGIQLSYIFFLIFVVSGEWELPKVELKDILTYTSSMLEKQLNLYMSVSMVIAQSSTVVRYNGMVDENCDEQINLKNSQSSGQSMDV